MIHYDTLFHTILTTLKIFVSVPRRIQKHNTHNTQQPK